jgi:hypothetical protein
MLHFVLGMDDNGRCDVMSDRVEMQTLLLGSDEEYESHVFRGTPRQVSDGNKVKLGGRVKRLGYGSDGERLGSIVVEDKMFDLLCIFQRGYVRPILSPVPWAQELAIFIHVLMHYHLTTFNA